MAPEVHKRKSGAQNKIANNNKTHATTKSAGKTPDRPPVHNPRLWYGTGIFLVAFYIFLVCVRSYIRGWYGFFDGIWLCNVAMLVSAYGFFARSNRFVSAGMTATFFPHLLWVIDLSVYCFTGRFPIGTAAYVMWPDIAWSEVISSTHHCWFIPLCFLALRRNGGYHKGAWLIAFLFIFPIVYTSTYIPEYATLDDGARFYMNINMVHGWWKDMTGWPWELFPPGTDPKYVLSLCGFVAFKFAVAYVVLGLLSYLFIRTD
eukprot:TRINITY_DN4942_c0_g1_i1.p1 TRINITY_DN4942_c0_g1~~TRINITY_DN4942_c0_g1_i1.p1  ORF type:complete len:260 (-),score=46.61 TRINITY_DN4942_c0_g1_i1:252-1031(-)